MEAIRQDMDQEAADELATIQRHRLLAVAVPVILPAEADLAVVHGQQPVVGDGDTVGVASDIVEDLGWPGKRPLRVDHPLGVPNRHQIPPERGWGYDPDVQKNRKEARQIIQKLGYGAD